MHIEFTPEQQELRRELRAYYQKLFTPELRAAFDAEHEEMGGPVFKEIVAKMGDDGWLGIGWPTEYGGQGRGMVEQLIFWDETWRAHGPLPVIGVNTIGPMIMKFGTEEQKRELLPQLLKGRIFFGVGYSEPSAGTDLASLQTRAVRDGDEYVINGQKIYTTHAQIADYIFLAARTDPEAKKHAGISYMLVPMRQDGIEVRGITQPDGTAEFCEVFFDNARCPKDAVVGGVNNGWKVANSTLAFERGQSATTGYRRFEQEYLILRDAAQENGAIDDPIIRQRLMEYYTKIQILRINGLRNLTTAVTGKKDMGTVILGATNKMFWSEMHKAAMELALDIYGADSMLVDTGPESGGWPGAMRDKRREGYPASPMISSFFFSRSETIWGGTSQIQRNIVGERVLGLPKEPKPASP